MLEGQNKDDLPVVRFSWQMEAMKPTNTEITAIS